MTLPDPELALAIVHAPARHRAALDALFGLDRQFGATLAQAREPMAAALRLAWWREALARLDTALPDAAAPPLLKALADAVMPYGIAGQALAALADPWEILLDPDPLSTGDLADYARGRAWLFVLAGKVLGAGDVLPRTGGEGWALADVARRLRDPAHAETARKLARERLEAALARPWPRAARPLGILVMLARADLTRATRIVGGPRRQLAMLRFALLGR